MREALNADGTPEPQLVGRYLMFGEIAAGGMASVHYGLLNGAVGFRRTVAIKKLHQQFASDPEFVEQFLDEARLAARIRHPNVVQTLDVVAENRQLLLVMEYVDGLTLARLLQLADARTQEVPASIVVSILVGALHGLHAAHEAKDELGAPLAIVHRDFSPQNILVGQDGVARVLDFGVAKAAARVHSTQGAKIKGKLRYMAPEQVQGEELDRRTDLFAAGIVLWQALTGRKLFDSSAGPAAIIQQVVSAPIVPPSTFNKAVPPELDSVVMRALTRDRKGRYQTAQEMAIALESSIRLDSNHHISRWQESLGSAELREREQVLSAIERTSRQEADPRASVSEIVSSPRAGSIPDITDASGEMMTAVVSPNAIRAQNATDSSQVTGVSNWTTVATKSSIPRWLPLGTIAGLAAGGLLWFFAFSGKKTESASSAIAAATPLVPSDSKPGTAATSVPQAEEPPATSKTEPRAPATPDNTVQTPAVATSAQSRTTAMKPAVTSTSAIPTKPKIAVPKTTTSKAPSTKPISTKPNCTNPTYVDASGIRRFRKECL